MASAASPRAQFDQVEEHVKGLKIHAMISSDIDENHASALRIPLGEATDEQLLAEIARRKIDVHHNITQDMVKSLYDFDPHPLGHGASGEVWRVTHKHTGEIYACKVIRRDNDMNDVSSMGTEIEIMKRVRHRHVVSLFELFETPSCLWLILELVDGGDLRGLVADHSHYSEAMAAKHMRQIMEGLHYLHSRGVVHRDIKLDNILIHGKRQGGIVKIADFGLSALIQVGTRGYDAHDSCKRKSYNKLTERWGTPMFYAPELIRGEYGPQVDVWSAGCVLFEMLTGDVPFDTDDNDEHWQTHLFAKIKTASYPKNKLAGISEEAQDFLAGLLNPSAEARMSATEALRHEWLNPQSLTERHSLHLKTAHEKIRSTVEKKSISVESKQQDDSNRHPEGILSYLIRRASFQKSK